MLEDKIIGNKYKIEKKLGSGTFGAVYQGINIRTREKVAIKVESNDTDQQSLKNETRVYQYLNGCKGVPLTRWFGTDLNNHYLVIDLLGISLTEARKQKIFSLSTILKIGTQILSILQGIHDKEMIHRDIKPDNFLIHPLSGLEQLYLIDFGLCKKYVHDSNPEQSTTKKTLIGTPNFASINAHQYKEVTRRDDLESLGYTLLYLYYGFLPWTNLTNISREEIKEMKITFLKNKQSEIPEVLLHFLNCVQHLKYNERPFYEKYTKEFLDALDNNKLSTKTI
jgi:serine/threonine protein kinase